VRLLSTASAAKGVISKSFNHQWDGVLPLAHLRSRLFGNFLVLHREHPVARQECSGEETSSEDARRKW